MLGWPQYNSWVAAVGSHFFSLKMSHLHVQTVILILKAAISTIELGSLFFIFLMPAKEPATILDIVVELDSSPLAFYSSCAPLNGHVFKLDVAH